MYKSKNTILGLVQTDHFSAEHHNLNSDKSLWKFSNIWPLAPILANNLVKVGGRIQHSNIQDQQKHKVHLPAAYHVKWLIVTHFHEKSNNCGGDQTLASVMEKFWIINSNQ